MVYDVRKIQSCRQPALVTFVAILASLNLKAAVPLYSWEGKRTANLPAPLPLVHVSALHGGFGEAQIQERANARR